MFVVVGDDGTQLSAVFNDRKQAEMEACWIAQLTAWQNAKVAEVGNQDRKI